MTARLVSAVALVVVVVVGCGGGDDGSDDDSIACGEIEAALAVIDEGVQDMALLGFPEQYEDIRSGEVDFDPAEFGEAVEHLRPLEPTDVSQITDSYGTVAEALDLYDEANDLLRQNLEVDDPFADGQGDELAVLIDDVDFITSQAAVRLAADIAGCEVPELSD